MVIDVVSKPWNDGVYSNILDSFGADTDGVHAWGLRTTPQRQLFPPFAEELGPLNESDEEFCQAKRPPPFPATAPFDPQISKFWWPA